MDTSMNKIFQWSGGIVALLGALIMWRGITKMIPATGWLNGGMFTLGGLVFVLLGLFFLWYPMHSKQKKEKNGQTESEG